jgi:hypothetical protein
MFCAPGLVFGGTVGVRSRLHIFTPGLVFGGTEASGPFFMFCAPRLIFGCPKGVGSRFHVLRARVRFQRYRGRRVPFSGFARLDSFSALPRASGPVFMFYAQKIIFGGTDGVRFRFHVLQSRIHFRRYGGCRVPFSCFVLPDTFSVASRASGPVFIVCAPVLVFGNTEGIPSHFNVFRSWTYFRRH